MKVLGLTSVWAVIFILNLLAFLSLQKALFKIRANLVKTV